MKLTKEEIDQVIDNIYALEDNSDLADYARNQLPDILSKLSDRIQHLEGILDHLQEVGVIKDWVK